MTAVSPRAPLMDSLTWYTTILHDIAPNLLQPGLGRACALAVDDPVAIVATRMIARITAECSGAAVARYCLGAPLLATEELRRAIGR